MKTWRFLLHGLLITAGGAGASSCEQKPATSESETAQKQAVALQGPESSQKKPEFPKGVGERDAKKQRGFKKLTGYFLADHNKNRYGQGFFVSREIMDEVIHQDGSDGVRIYLAQAKKNDAPYLIIVGTKKDSTHIHRDLVSTDKTGNIVGTSYLVVRSDDKCPENCDADSPFYHK
ncbi:hypothetical protein MUN84_18460 [Hymenobacter sp. 5516J-16]|uniref:hypothetical protein n=1 Tax=Hymenobacter sp. 5516J-16 TaxID=2932253 RepID=UPI001FD18F8C|nr:hypothetical protein [Hymenobacter sp. 5516J-16]UOQ76503.1 hypothetical protein MUN84_18460 [Hymenobacter sp. 5516J-16]